ncbi:MAG: tetratricopeptide repeat protein [Acidobacteria bacterium]|nr:tetratricopeptide repeat protein [Acidobacteriota bacterium]
MGAHRAAHQRPVRRGAAIVLIVIAVVVALCSVAVRAQPGQTETPAAPAHSLAALVERLRAKPLDGNVLDEARGVGVELLRAGRFDDAARLFGVIREVAPLDRATLYGGALAHFNLKRMGEAEEWARAAIGSAPRTATGSAPRTATGSAPRPETGGVGVTAQQQPGERSFGNVSDAHVLLGVVLAVKGDNAGALEAVTRAVEVAPDNFDAQLALGRALYGAGDPAAASRAFRAAVSLRPGHATARFFLATTLEGAGDDEGALAAYRELIAARPEMAEGHLGVGVLLVKRSGGATNAEAVRELERALALDGNLYEGRVALGRALIRAGRATDAVEHLKRAAELAPRNPEPHYQLAVAYRRLGRKAEAERESAIVRGLHEEHRGGPVSKTGAGAASKPNQ